MGCTGCRRRLRLCQHRSGRCYRRCCQGNHLHQKRRHRFPPSLAHPLRRSHPVQRFPQPRRCQARHLRFQPTRPSYSGLPWQSDRRCRSRRQQNSRHRKHLHRFLPSLAHPLRRSHPVQRFPQPRRRQVLQLIRPSHSGLPWRSVRRSRTVPRLLAGRRSPAVPRSPLTGQQRRRDLPEMVHNCEGVSATRVACQPTAAGSRLG